MPVADIKPLGFVPLVRATVDRIQFIPFQFDNSSTPQLFWNAGFKGQETPSLPIFRPTFNTCKTLEVK
jgi:hypothetical protein